MNPGFRVSALLWRRGGTVACALLLIGSATIGFAQIAPSKESLSDLYPGKAYSPYAERSFPDRVFWGDTHLHTGLSMDAGLFGARLGLDEAYRFARGEQVTASSGQPARLGRPLDWLVIADHSDGMGFFNDLAAGDPDILKFDQAKPWYEGLQAGGEASAEAALSLIGTFSQGEIDPEMMADYSPGGKTYASIWEKVVDAAERFNDPGHFTTLIGFEWTSLVKGNNLHRNVIFREGAEKAGQVVPYTTQAPVGSTDPLELYKYLENYEAKTGGSALALAHNGNLSNGIMFPVDAQYTGRKLDEKYVEARARWERMYEITQIKGDGEAHPFLSPDDAFADYETWDAGNLDLSEAKTRGHAAVRVRPRGAEERAAAGGAARHQPLQVRPDRLHRQPHRSFRRRGGELLRQGDQCRALTEAHAPSLHQDRERRLRGL